MAAVIGSGWAPEGVLLLGPCQEETSKVQLLLEGRGRSSIRGQGSLWLEEGRLTQGHAPSGLGRRRPYELLVTATSPKPAVPRGTHWGHQLRGSELS